MSNDVVVTTVGRGVVESKEVLQKSLPKYWDRDYVNDRLERIENHEHKMLFRFLWYSGVRITEAISLKKENIDFRDYMMTIRWQKSRKWENRVIPMHPELREVLQLYCAKLNLADKVFPISRQQAWSLCKKYFGGHPHQLRHSFAVNWLRNGGDVVILSRYLGHSHIRTTMEYLKIVPIDQGRELLKIQFK